MINLLRLLQGYVVFEAEGGFVERFLNLCKLNSILLWNIKNDGVKVVAFTSAEDFKRLNLPAQRSGMDIKTVKQKGLPFFANRHKWRFGVALGLFLAVIVTLYMSTLVWQVEIVAKDGVKINGFTEAVAELGVKTGARKSEIDILEVQEQLLNSFPELSWVSLNIFGTKAQIEYNYAKPQKQITDTKMLTNVVAGKSGEIVLVDGYAGENKVQKGSFVAEGSLLISGILKNADNTESFVHARGKVLARTENLIYIKNPSEYDAVIVVASQPVYKLVFFGLVIPFGREAESMAECQVQLPLYGNGTQLPVGVTRVDSLLSQNAKVTLDDTQATLLSLLEGIRCKRNDYAAAQLESVKLSAKKEGNSCGVMVEIKCVENIAVEQPVVVEEN